MSNVEYKCPVCGSRLFAIPGGTRLRCPKDDVPYEQTEFLPGADRFNFKDDKGKVHVANEFERNVKAMSDKDAKQYMREEWRKLTGSSADGRWSNDTLFEEIQKLRQDKNPLTVDQQGAA